MAPVKALDQASFAPFMAASVGVIVRVVDGDEPEFPVVVREHFDREYPGAFQYAVFNRKTVKVDAWWRKHFSNGLVVIPAFGKNGQEGYYLFLNGVATTYTSGRTGRKDRLSSADIEDAGAILAYAVTKDASQFRKDRSQRLERIGAVVANELEGFLSFSKKGETIMAAVAMRRSGPTQPPPSPLAPASETLRDDYDLIGSTCDASNEELRRAYHAKVKQNAPDKLAQMDPELQEIATERMKKINGAWERIKQARGM